MNGRRGPGQAKLTGYVVTAHVFVDELLALGARFARPADLSLGRLLVLSALKVPPVIFCTSLTLVPGDVMRDTLAGSAGHALELRAVGLRMVHLAGVARRRQAEAELGEVLEGGAYHQVIVAVESLLGRVPLHVMVLQQLRAVGTLQIVPPARLDARL